MFGRKKEISLHVAIDKCNACGKCMMQCRRNAIGLGYEEYTICAKLMHPENCSGCGKCAKNCPQNAIEIKINKPSNTHTDSIDAMHCVSI